jgi:hypothetical protein
MHYFRGWHNLVGVASRYGLHVLRFDPNWGARDFIFVRPYRPDMGPGQPPAMGANSTSGRQ